MTSSLGPDPIETFFNESSVGKRSAAMKKGAPGRSNITQLCYLNFIASKLTLRAERGVEVVGSCRSEDGFDLPVVKYTLINGSFLVVRYNDNNFIVSVSSQNFIRLSFLRNMFHEEMTDPCKGLPRNLVFGSYVQNPQKFTSHIETGLLGGFIHHFNSVNRVDSALTGPTLPDPQALRSRENCRL